MSSIEKFVDRLMHNGTSGPAPAKPSPVATAPVAAPPAGSPAASGDSAARVANIDLKRLAALGMLTPDKTRSLIAEEYRAIKRPLLKNAFSARAVPVDHPNLIMVTSAVAGEGKSFTSINLAMSIALEMDHTVLLVEADVAKPATARYLGLPNDGQRGLVDYLSGDNVGLEELLMRTNIPKLSLLRAGRAHPHATELLSSNNMRRLTQELAQRYPDRVVIFDCPPLLISSEAVVMSTLVGQIVMVVESGVTPQRVVKDALGLIGQDKIVGVVLNKSTGRASRGFGYGYYGSYGYHED